MAGPTKTAAADEINEIQKTLFSMQDAAYRDFQAKLLPTVAPERFIGVRTPELRAYAKELLRENRAEAFLAVLPHRYFDENQLHAFILCVLKDFDRSLRETDRFLPYVDNWATCDQLSPKAFRKNRPALLPAIEMWLHSDMTYTVRFAVGMLMEHFLGEDFSPVYPEMVAAIKSDEYYVNMMRAWYFATALAKQPAAVTPCFEHARLDVWTHNKAIQKAVESYRITPEQKAYLKTLKRR